MKMQSRALSVVVVLLAACSVSGQERASSFEALDKDKDGLISVREAKTDRQVASQFASADKNQDGFLSREEFNSIKR